MSVMPLSSSSVETPLPTALYRCKTFEEQCLWVRRQLELGRTLTDPGIWLAGAEPDTIMRALRKAGLAIKTVKKAITDAAGDRQRVLAWRLYKEDEPRPAPRLRKAPLPA